MDILTIKEDIEIFCITASSFPEGVKEAHETLHSQIEFSSERNYYGVFWMDNGKMIYKAAASELVKGDLQHLDLEKETIPAGNYYYIDVPDFMNNIPKIGASFQKLTDEAPIDEASMGIEWYLTMDTVRCMVREKI